MWTAGSAVALITRWRVTATSRTATVVGGLPDRRCRHWPCRRPEEREGVGGGCWRQVRCVSRKDVSYLSACREKNYKALPTGARLILRTPLPCAHPLRPVRRPLRLRRSRQPRHLDGRVPREPAFVETSRRSPGRRDETCQWVWRLCRPRQMGALELHQKALPSW